MKIDEIMEMLRVVKENYKNGVYVKKEDNLIRLTVTNIADNITVCIEGADYGEYRYVSLTEAISRFIFGAIVYEDKDGCIACFSSLIGIIKVKEEEEAVESTLKLIRDVIEKTQEEELDYVDIVYDITTYIAKNSLDNSTIEIIRDYHREKDAELGILLLLLTYMHAIDRELFKKLMYYPVRMHTLTKYKRDIVEKLLNKGFPVRIMRHDMSAAWGVA